MAEGESSFGSLLRAAREGAKLTRLALATRVGLDAGHLYRIETGGRRPSQESALALAAALEIGDTETMRWLEAAGYKPVPLLSQSRSSVRVRGGRRLPRVEASPSLEWTPAYWTSWLQAVGLHETAIVDMLEAMETAQLATRQSVSESLRSSIARATEWLLAPVKTAVIPVAGGQHHLLAPHVVQQLLLSTIREAAEAGITSIVLVLAVNSVDSLYEPLKAALDLSVVPKIRLQYVLQEKPLGLGDAILLTEPFIGNSPFAVLLPDDILRRRTDRPSHIAEFRRMAQAWSCLDALKANHMVAITKVSKTRMPHCGVVELGASRSKGVFQINRLVEKPVPPDAVFRKHNVAGIIGRYILHPDIFAALGKLRETTTLPLELTDALEQVRQESNGAYAFELDSAPQDIGKVLGKANEAIEDSLRGH